MASQVLPEPGPPRITSRLHCRASSSASASCSPAGPVALTRSLRSIAAGVSTGPPSRGSCGHGSVFSQPISVFEVDLDLVKVGAPRRQPVHHVPEQVLHVINKVIQVLVHAEQGLVQRAGLVGHLLQAGQHHLLEDLWLQVEDRELEQATGDGSGGRTRVFRGPAVAGRQAVGDLAGQLLQLLVQFAPGEQTPGLLLLQQLPQVADLVHG